MTREYKKLGVQAPKEYAKFAKNNFAFIQLNGNYAYCKSHNFIYNPKVEEEKLYNAQPCYYTDKRFDDGMNYFKQTYLHFFRCKRRPNKRPKNSFFNLSFDLNRNKNRGNKKKRLSLKACLRRVKNLKGVNKGDVILFETGWHFRENKVYLAYVVKIKKDKPMEVTYEVSEPSYFNNFKNDPKSFALVELLRNNGFLVQVWNSNPGFIYGEDDGEIAIAYGYGKKIGFSSFENSFRGYANGRGNILWDNFDEFDKWSKAYSIPKDTTPEEIINILKTKQQTEE